MMIIKSIVTTVLIIITVIYCNKKDGGACSSSLQEKVFKFHEIYGNDIGYSVRSNKMKRYIIDGNMDSFYKTRRNLQTI